MTTESRLLFLVMFFFTLGKSFQEKSSLPTYYHEICVTNCEWETWNDTGVLSSRENVVLFQDSYTDVEDDPSENDDIKSDGELSIPGTISSTNVMRRGREEEARKRRLRPYPTFVHCRGIIKWCVSPCTYVNKDKCNTWPYLCPPNILADIPTRCKVQCVHNYKRMRKKFRNPAKLPQLTGVFDYRWDPDAT